MQPHASPDQVTRPDSLTRAKATLDVVLAGATLLYAFGYGAWAVYAWETQLGVPPALHSQYLIAGVVPALILLFLFLILRALERLRFRLRGEPGARAKRIGGALTTAGVAFVVVGGFVGGVAHRDPTVLVGAGLALFLGGTLTAPRDRADRWFAVGTSWYLSVSTSLLALVVFLLYATRVFPKLPTELGGPRPQCVRLDVDARRLSRYTLDALEDPTAARRDSLVVRTKPLFLLLQADQYVLAPVDSAVRRRAFRLNEGVVMAVFPDTTCVRPHPSA